jgi:hypothetical protein
LVSTSGEGYLDERSKYRLQKVLFVSTDGIAFLGPQDTAISARINRQMATTCLANNNETILNIAVNTAITNVNILISIRPQVHSTVHIATGYELDDRSVGVRVKVGSKFYFLHIVRIGSGVHLTSYLTDIGWAFFADNTAGA